MPRNIGLFPFVYMCPAIPGCFLSCAYGTVDVHVPRNIGVFPLRVPIGQWICMCPKMSFFSPFVCLWGSGYTCTPKHQVFFSPLSRAYWTVDIHVPQNIGFFPFVCLWDSRYTCALKYRGFPFVCLWDSGYTYALKYRGFSLSSAYIP